MTPSWIEIFGSLAGAACVGLPVRESLCDRPVGTVDNFQVLVPFRRAAAGVVG